MNLIRRYARFALFFAATLIGSAVAALMMRPVPAMLVGFDFGACVFLAAVLWSLSDDEAEDMRKRAAANEPDQGILLIIGLVIAGAVIGAVGYETMTMRGPEVALSIGTLVLSWVFANLLFALHYAHSWYLDDGSGKDRKGIDFPGRKNPVYWDFVYFSFVLGMTFQVSDCDITATGMRKVALAQSVVAFWFNIGVLALSISVIGNLLH